MMQGVFLLSFFFVRHLIHFQKNHINRIYKHHFFIDYRVKYFINIYKANIFIFKMLAFFYATIKFNPIHTTA